MRTLLAAPKALLLDEPFSKLDSELKRDFRRFVFDRAIAKRLPVLLVTHDPTDAKAADGPILQLGQPTLAERVVIHDRDVSTVPRDPNDIAAGSLKS